MSSFSFRCSILILPGLGNSGEDHWQSIWQKEFGFQRILQGDWNTPVSDDWVKTIDDAVHAHNTANVILVGHSLACNAIAQWSDQSREVIKGAMLVAPSDTEAPSYPSGTRGFNPMPIRKLRFQSIVIASSNDPYVTLDRAIYFASCWGSKFVNIGNAGHINAASGHGSWREGLTYLGELDVL